MRRLALFLVFLAFGLTFASDPPRTKLTGVEVTRSLVLPDCDDDYGSKEPGELCRVPSTGEVRRWNGSSWVAIGGGEGTEDITYTVENASGTYRVRNADGSVVYSSSDAGEAIDYAIDAVGDSGGVIVLRPGDTFTYTSTTPTFEPNRTGWTRVIGYGAVVEVSQSAPRAFHFHKIADGDVFRWIWVEGITIDGAGAAGSGSVNGVLFGNYVGGSNDPARVSWEHVRVINILAYDVPHDPTTSDHIGLIRLRVRDSGWSGTPYIDDFIVDGAYIKGGNYGILITGGVASEKNTTWIGRLEIRNAFHDMRPSGSDNQPYFFASTCFHIGGYSPIKSAVMENLVCYAPGDNCFEMNNAEHGRMHNLTCWNPNNVGITLANHIVMDEPEEQDLSVSNMVMRVTERPTDRGVPPVITVGGGNGATTDHNPQGNVLVSGIAYDVSLDSTLAEDLGISAIINTSRDTAIRKLMISDVTADIDVGPIRRTVDDLYSVGLNIRPYPWDWDGDGISEPCRVFVSDVSASYRMWKDPSGAKNVSLYGVDIASPVLAEVSDVHVYVDTGSESLYNFSLLYVASSATGAKMGVRARNCSGDYRGSVSSAVRDFVIPNGPDYDYVELYDVHVKGGDWAIGSDVIPIIKVAGMTDSSMSSAIAGMVIDEHGPVVSDYRSSPTANHRVGHHLLIGDRFNEDLAFIEDLNGNWSINMHAWVNEEEDGGTWVTKWRVPEDYSGNRYFSRILLGNGSQYSFQLTPNQTVSGGEEITNWKVGLHIGMGDWDGDGIYSNPHVSVGSSSSDLRYKAAFSVLGNTANDYIAKFNSTNTNVRVGVHQDGDLGVDGELQLGAAEMGSEGSAFCQYRLSNDTILLDADCDRTQDPGETCLAAGGRDPDCDGTAELLKEFWGYRSNVTASLNSAIFIYNGAGSKWWYVTKKPITLTYLECWANEDITAGTITVTAYGCTAPGSCPDTTDLEVVIDASSATWPSPKKVYDDTCTTNCRVDAGKYVYIALVADSSLSPSGSAEVVCRVEFEEDQ